MKGKLSYRLSIVGASIVIGSALLTFILQKIVDYDFFKKFGSIIGFSVLLGLLMSLAGMLVGLSKINSSDLQDKVLARKGLLLGLGVVIAFSVYTFIGMQSTGFNPVK
ncbi:MAG: hypothetical protein H7Y12_10225 [Sphingobacteriaceae bacterium]|nr:hypothetical protein [Cytophagaceae bacterium]